MIGSFPASSRRPETISAAENATLTSEKSGNRTAFPEGDSFAEQLNWHLAFGTRPGGGPDRPGKRWNNKEFAEAVLGSATDPESGSRVVRNWRAGRNRPQQLGSIERALFGDNDAYRHWRFALRTAYDGRPVLGGDNIIRLPAVPVRDARGAPAAAQATFPRYRQSIAVMRFRSLGGTENDTYFADGVVEDVVTDLSRFNNLFVIAPSTSFGFSSGLATVEDVSQQLGVRYIVEGATRRSAGRVRTSARLVDTATGGSLWAERFECAGDDLFAMQDEITTRIVSAVEPTVMATEIDRATRKSTDNLDAYDLYLRALPYRGLVTKDGLIERYKILRSAIAIDPGYARSLVNAANCYSVNRDQMIGIPWLQDDAERMRLIDAALEAGADDEEVLCVAAHARATLTGDFAASVGLLDRALEINPNHAEAWIRSSLFRMLLDDLDGAVAHANRAIVLSPRDRNITIAHMARGYAFLYQGKLEEAVVAAKRAAVEMPHQRRGYHLMIAALVELGRLEEASAAAAAYMREVPHFRISTWRKHPQIAADRRNELIVRNLRRVNMPD